MKPCKCCGEIGEHKKDCELFILSISSEYKNEKICHLTGERDAYAVACRAESRLVENLKDQLQKSKQREAVLLKEIESAYAYLKATYDIHTWKDEPEYQMMKSFEQALEKYRNLTKNKDSETI